MGPTATDIERFNDSLERCQPRSQFLARFYELFLASSPMVRAKFTNTDLHKLQRSLGVSLYMMISVAEGRLEATVHLERLAQRHSRHDRDIEPRLYDLWLDTLIKAVREYDPYCSPEVEHAWRAMLAPGIDYLKSRY